jgi:hypothetical protein
MPVDFILEDIDDGWKPKSPDNIQLAIEYGSETVTLDASIIELSEMYDHFEAKEGITIDIGSGHQIRAAFDGPDVDVSFENGIEWTTSYADFMVGFSQFLCDVFARLDRSYSLVQRKQSLEEYDSVQAAYDDVMTGR